MASHFVNDVRSTGAFAKTVFVERIESPRLESVLTCCQQFKKRCLFSMRSRYVTCVNINNKTCLT